MKVLTKTNVNNTRGVKKPPFGNSSISLVGSEEQINVSQKSPNVLKMASESFIRDLLLFFYRSFFSKFPVGSPCLSSGLFSP